MIARWNPAACLVAISALSVPSMAAGQPADVELLAGAAARIEEHRKADATVTVLDAAGRPVPAARVDVTQSRHAFLFGSNIYTWGRHSTEKAEAEYRRQFAELLNYATLGFYWASYEPHRGEPNHERTEQIARWCREQGILAKGHPLAWNHADPRWLPDDADEVLRLQMARIEDCVARFRGLIDRWDVVNEAAHFERDEFVRRAPKLTAAWQHMGRMEFTRACFQQARKAGPEALLLINDYRTDPAYEPVVEQLVGADGRPLYDVIGIQSHMHGGAWSNETIWNVCERYARFGVPLHFTEVTILSGQRQWNKPAEGAWPSTPEGEAHQAREVVRFYTMLFSHPAVEAITWWDFSDFGAWKGAPAGFLRADMTPKPAYDELKKLIKDTWWTRASLSTGPAGTAKFRGFLGDYQVVVTEGDRTVAQPFTLLKDAENRWTVRIE
jgi:endo-1,4-beta-xylanase